MAKPKNVASAATSEDVDEFLNESTEVKIEDLSPEEVDKLDLSQIPPPPNETVVTDIKRDTVVGITPKGTPKQINFSRFGFNKRPITTDLSDEMLPPITKKRTAIYQLLGVDTGGHSYDKRIDHNDNPASRIVDTADVEMHHTYSIYDTFEKDFGRRDKTVTFFDGVQRYEYTDPITKEVKADIRQKLGKPAFVRGQAMVDIMKNYHQYLWWELHPKNKSNKYRDKQIAATFERIDLKYVNPHVDQMKMEIKLDAMNFVRALSADKAMDLAAALDIPTFREQPSTIKTALYVMAESDPERVMFKSPNKAISVTASAMRALDFGILDFDAERKQYFFAQNVDSPIYQVPLDEPPLQSLAKFLIDSSEGMPIREKMDEYINYWI